jgi:hypothetical protein
MNQINVPGFGQVRIEPTDNYDYGAIKFLAAKDGSCLIKVESVDRVALRGVNLVTGNPASVAFYQMGDFGVVVSSTVQIDEAIPVKAMTREEFVIWFEQRMGKLNHFGDTFSTYEEQVNYEPLIYDQYSINQSDVEYSFQELEWGYTNYITRQGSFEEFVAAKEQDNLKHFGKEKSS